MISYIKNAVNPVGFIIVICGTVKRILAYACHAVRYRYTSKAIAVFKRIIGNALCSSFYSTICGEFVRFCFYQVISDIENAVNPVGFVIVVFGIVERILPYACHSVGYFNRFHA